MFLQTLFYDVFSVASEYKTRVSAYMCTLTQLIKILQHTVIGNAVRLVTVLIQHSHYVAGKSNLLSLF